MAGSVTDKLITLGELKVGLDTKVNTSDVQDIAHGGTNAATAAGARTNLDVYSKSETDDAIQQSTATALEQMDKSTTKMIVVFGYQKNAQTYRAPLYFRAPASVVKNYTVTPTADLNVNGSYFIPKSEITIAKTYDGLWTVETANANAAGRIATLFISVT